MTRGHNTGTKYSISLGPNLESSSKQTLSCFGHQPANQPTEPTRLEIRAPSCLVAKGIQRKNLWNPFCEPQARLGQPVLSVLGLSWTNQPVDDVHGQGELFGDWHALLSPSPHFNVTNCLVSSAHNLEPVIRDIQAKQNAPSWLVWARTFTWPPWWTSLSIACNCVGHFFCVVRLSTMNQGISSVNKPQNANLALAILNLFCWTLHSIFTHNGHLIEAVSPIMATFTLEQGELLFFPFENLVQVLFSKFVCQFNVKHSSRERFKHEFSGKLNQVCSFRERELDHLFYVGTRERGHIIITLTKYGCNYYYHHSSALVVSLMMIIINFNFNRLKDDWILLPVPQFLHFLCPWQAVWLSKVLHSIYHLLVCFVDSRDPMMATSEGLEKRMLSIRILTICLLVLWSSLHFHCLLCWLCLWSIFNKFSNTHSEEETWASQNGSIDSSLFGLLLLLLSASQSVTHEDHEDTFCLNIFYSFIYSFIEIVL